MPLAFESTSHGTVAFGFFNIESDMLLLDRYFFFATDFCREICALADRSGDDPVETVLQIDEIDNPRDIGDLMGAIHGVRHVGFIGETYRRFPFPEQPEGFKQDPDGARNRELFAEMIEKYARRISVPLVAQPGTAALVGIGRYQFSVPVFHELLDYVWRGGYPRYRDDVRPSGVLEMKRCVERSGSWLFHGVEFSSP